MKLADLKKSGFDWNSILEFCRKYIRYISAGVIVVILVIVLAVTAVNNGKENVESKAGNEVSQEQSENFAVDAIPEINTLIANYYAAYAAGDFEALGACATPVSDIEKSYIAVVNEHIAGYNNIQCHTKSGLAEDEYAVSVVVDMQFAGIEQTVPGVDFFYVRKNEDGSYYIDNLYSGRFNLAFRELELDSQIEAFIAEYEVQDDVVKLLADVQAKYDEALSANEELNTANNNLVQAVQTWVVELTGGGEDTQIPEEQEEPVIPEEEVEPEEPATPEEQGEPEEPATPEEQGGSEEPEQTTTTAETVYVTDNVNIRKEPNESAEKAGSAVAGQSFTRTGTTEDGWSEIEYDGGKAYIKSEYLSTDAAQAANPEEADNNAGYLAEGTTITANQAYNVREGMSEDAERVGTVDPGDKIEVVMSYEEGWTKVKWNDKAGYIKTDLLLNN